MTGKESSREDKDNAADLAGMLGVGGFLDGVSNLISKFGDLAERGEALKKSMGDSQASAKPIRTSGGFTVRFGGLASDEADQASVRPVDTAARQRSSSPKKAEAVVPKEREAAVELFEEEDHLLLVAEMPGVATENVELDFHDKCLSIKGHSKTAVFQAQVELPRAFTSEQVAVTANNGVVEIRLTT